MANITIQPNEDVEHSAEEYPLSTGALFYTEIDEGSAVPNTADYIYWEGSGVGWMIFGCETPDLTNGSAINVKIRVYANAPGEFVRDATLAIAPDGTTWSGAQTFGVATGGAAWYEKDFAVDTNDLSNLKFKIDSQDQGPGKAIEIYTIEVVIHAVFIYENVKLNIGDVFKEVTAMKINIGDVWKTVTGMKINIGDVWKKVF